MTKIYTHDLRIVLPEVILLEQNHFREASEISSSVDEPHSWGTYLNALAMLGFQEWLNNRILNKIIQQYTNVHETCSYLSLGEFTLCLIATENVLDEVVEIPQNIVEQPEVTAQFYVILEVLEEEEQIIFRGFLPDNELINYCNLAKLQSGCYHLPLGVFDDEPNHLLFYSQILVPNAVISVASETSVSKLTKNLQETRTKLSQWLENVFTETWIAIDALLNSEANLALSTRNIEVGVKRAKLIDLEMRLGNQTVALLVNITQPTEDKLGILVQLHPTGGERFLPQNLQLTLLSKAGKILQQVESRSQDNYIQLKPFRGEIGKHFSLEVSLGGIRIKEDFEL